MDAQFSPAEGDMAERGLRYTKDQFDELLHQTEDYVRENPMRSIGYAVAAGFVLNRLPLGRIVGGMTRLAFLALKPAIIAYGATKLYHATQNEEL